MLGPAGWTMPICVAPGEVGSTLRYEWESDDDARSPDQSRFGFEGEVLESMPPHRGVTTERLIDTDGPTTTNELTLTPVEGGTLMCIVITYPDTALRATILGTRMVEGMETSYARLDDVLSGAP